MASLHSIFGRLIHHTPTQPIVIAPQPTNEEKLRAALKTLNAERIHLLQWMNAGDGCPNDVSRLEELSAKIEQCEEELYTMTAIPPIPSATRH